MESKDRERAEQWLAARLDDADDDLRSVATGDALLVADAVLHLAPRWGEKGRFALLRVAIWELLAGVDQPPPEISLEELIARAIREKGSIESVRDVLVRAAAIPRVESERAFLADQKLTPYPLARDYAQTLIAHAMARRLPAAADVRGFLAAVHENLDHGESYADWSFA